jgi:general secretion pathway protein G
MVNRLHPLPTEHAALGRNPVNAGFTLVELLVVMAILATLLAIVGPRYTRSVDLASESALRTNLKTLRSAIDQHVADTGQYPDQLDDLVKKHYLREVPIDPVTARRDQWIAVEHPGKRPGIFDVRSSAPGTASDGSLFATW